jgi:hypothetical protein
MFSLPLAFAQGGEVSLSFSVEPPAYSITAGSIFEVTVFVNATVPLNAHSARLRYSSETLAVEGISDADSIIDVWQESPTVEKRGVMDWTGGSFAPFSGEKGEILTITFRAIAKGRAELSFESAKSYVADGKGTLAPVNTPTLSFAVLDGGPASGNAASDNIPPFIDTASLETNPFNPEQKILGFIAKDSGSGIRAVEARYRTFITWSEWQRVRTPAAFPADAWAVNIRVSDNRGNQSAQVVYHWPSFFKSFSSSIFSLLALAALAIVIRKRRNATATRHSDASRFSK